MGPCAACGQLTELEVDFCPACAGYAAPATIYSYAPSRLSRSDGSLEQVLAPLPSPPAPAQEERLAALGEGRLPPPEPIPAGDLAARLRVSTRQRREGRWLVLSAMLIVLIIAAGAVLLELGRPGSASTPRPRAAASATAPAVKPTQTIPTAPGPQVSVAPPAASSPDEAVVLSFLASYFTAINGHDFAAYLQLFSPSLRQELSAPTFSAGYGTTADTQIRLTSIAVIGAGEIVAQVSFVSHQQPSASPTNSACTSWVVALYLLPQDGSYLLQQPPAGYQASFSACS